MYVILSEATAWFFSDHAFAFSSSAATKKFKPRLTIAHRHPRSHERGYDVFGF
jgi:hypothetical protein